MMLVGANTFLNYVKTYRVLWIRSKYGSGKTALSFRLAYDLVSSGAVRYVLSNCKSPWVDDPASVELREGRYVDAVMILDEGGLFMGDNYRANRYLAFLRKLNVIVIIPSIKRPAAVARDLSVKRVYNFGVAGIPLWVYRFTLLDSEDKSSETFYWWQPSEIFGVYDTGGFPSSDAELQGWLEKWTTQAAAAAGYKYEAGAGGSFRIEAGGADDVDVLRGVSEGLEEAAAQQSALISVLRDVSSKR